MLVDGGDYKHFVNIVTNTDNTVEFADASSQGEGRVRVNFKGIKVFIPLSQLVGNNTNEYGGKTIRFKVIENEKNR